MSIKSALCFILIFVLLLTVFTLSALAVDGFDGQPIMLHDNVTLRYSGRDYSEVVDFAPEDGFYAYTIPSGTFIASTEYNGYVHLSGSLNSSGTTNGSVEGYPGLYYAQLINVSFSSPSVPSFTSHADAFAALSEFIESENTPSPSLRYSLPPGNAIYIRVSTGATYTLRTRMPESVLGSNHYPGNNQVITLVSSLPSGGTAPTSPLIPWQQDGALSVLGLSRNAVYNGTNASSGYLCIVNPLYYSGTANGPYEFLSNGSIDISLDRQSGFVVFPLDSTLGFTSGLGINVDTEILDTPYTGEIDSETGEITWQDSSGGTSAPTTGGGNLVSTSETIFDFLRNIGDEIATFLKGPIQAIQTVVSAIREFLASFTQLYMWLPAPVYNLITSALMIALTIGVIKIFV